MHCLARPATLITICHQTDQEDTISDDPRQARRIFLAGATGVIGRPLVPLLVAAGYEVVGTTRADEKRALLEGLGARPVVVDVYDRAALIATLREVRPAIVIHQLTDLAARDFAANARIRQEGTRNLVDAARAVGVRRFVAQSIAFAYGPGDHPAREEEPLASQAVQEHEDAVLTLPEGIVLRYGLLYGPGTWYTPDGMVVDEVRRGERTADEAITSFLHVDDAAEAALLALDWPPGVVNIVDDEPAAARDWLPHFAALLGLPPPPIATGRPPAARGASNARARQELRWQPRYPTWRTGFEHAFAAS